MACPINANVPIDANVPIIASALTKICICLKYFKSREGHYIVLYNLIFK